MIDWAYISLYTLVILGLGTFVLVSLFYVRFGYLKSKQKTSEKKYKKLRYFYRYDPYGLVAADDPTPERKRVGLSLNRMFYLFMVLFPVTITVVLLSSAYNNRSLFLAPVKLSVTERSQVASTKHVYLSNPFVYAPTLKNVILPLKDKHEIVLFNEDYLAGRKNTWSMIFNKYSLPYSQCSPKSFDLCLKDKKNALIIADMRLTAWEDVITAREAGHHIIAYGYSNDIQTITKDKLGLEFVPADASVITNREERIALVGDRELTLGLEPGLNFSLVRANKSWKVLSDKPQAIVMHYDGRAGGDINTRLFALANKGTRFVWVGFDPGKINAPAHQKTVDYSNHLIASILRYATGGTYQSVATWPDAKLFSAFFDNTIESDFQQAVNIANVFSENDMPVTWYLLSDAAQMDRNFTRRLATMGELGCSGNNGDIFTRYNISEQTLRLKECAKVLEKISGHKVNGFKPPANNYNDDTWSALANADLQYLKSDLMVGRSMPVVMYDETKDSYVTHFSSSNSDDEFLWKQLKLDRVQSLVRVQDEVDWISAVGAAYGFSSQTKHLMVNENLESLKLIVKDIKYRNAYVATSADINEWLIFRKMILDGRHVTEKMPTKFNPVMLSVNEEGQLIREPYEAMAALFIDE